VPNQAQHLPSPINAEPYGQRTKLGQKFGATMSQTRQGFRRISAESLTAGCLRPVAT